MINRVSGVAAVMLVKDEADIIGHTVFHLAGQVDRVIVADNLSTDDTWETLNELRLLLDGQLILRRDNEVGYYQDSKTTALAHEALELGYDWVIPCDADEYWYSPHGRIGDVLDGLPHESLFARALLYNHMPTSIDDPATESPFERIGWRLRRPGALPKVACRTSPHLRIGMGNHEAWTQGRAHSGNSHTVEDLVTIRHFPWRSRGQYVRKIENGVAAYAATSGVSEEYGAHWRAHGDPSEEGFEARCAEWFYTWGHSEDPATDAGLIYDPAPR